MGGKTFDLERLRPGLTAIRLAVSAAHWDEADSLLYGGLSGHGESVRVRQTMERVRDAFPAEIWAALDREDRAAKAALLRAQADALDPSTPAPSQPRGEAQRSNHIAQAARSVVSAWLREDNRELTAEDALSGALDGEDIVRIVAYLLETCANGGRL